MTSLNNTLRQAPPAPVPVQRPAFVPSYVRHFANNYLVLQQNDAATGTSSLTLANNVAPNVRMESGIAVNSNRQAYGFLSRIFPLPYSLGVLDAKVSTENLLSFALVNTTAINNVTLGVTSGFNPYPTSSLNQFGESCYLGVTAEHAREFVAGSLGLRTAFKNDNYLRSPIVDASLSVGYQGFSVGAGFSLDTSNTLVTASNLGAEYSPNADLTVTAFSNTDVLLDKVVPKSTTVATWVRLDNKTQLGLGVDLKGPDSSSDGVFSNLSQSTIAAAVKYQLDAATNLKLRYTAQQVTANVDFSFANPKAKVALVGGVDPRAGTLKGAIWGVNVTLGDYYY